MLFHMSFSLSFALDQGLQHGYYELIDSIKKALSSFQPQRASIASYRWGYSLLSIIPVTKGLTGRNPYYYWRCSLLPINPATEGLSSRKPSYCLDIHSYSSYLLQRASAAKNPHIHYYLSFQPQMDLNSKKPSYCWRYLLLSIIPATEGPQQQKLLLPLGIFISSARESLIRKK